MSAQPARTRAHSHRETQLMSSSEIDRTLVRLAHEIVEKTGGVQNLGLVGIKRRGVPLAQRLGKLIQRIERVKTPVGSLDIALYRDDLTQVAPKPVVQKAEIGFDVAGMDIILVDDVLFTGRTTRAAMDALFDHGRPRRVQLCVLMDRGHRELPIEAAFVGRRIETSLQQVVKVNLSEVDSFDKVILVEMPPR